MRLLELEDKIYSQYNLTLRYQRDWFLNHKEYNELFHEVFSRYNEYYFDHDATGNILQNGYKNRFKILTNVGPVNIYLCPEKFSETRDG